jgi:hypothetical protein
MNNLLLVYIKIFRIELKPCSQDGKEKINFDMEILGEEKPQETFKIGKNRRISLER